MSLDVSLYMSEPVPTAKGSGIFVREGGQTLEITREEWAARNPGRDPVLVTADDEGESCEVFEANVTHNLNKMADAAGIYEALWHPEQLDPERGALIRAQEEAKNYHGAGGVYELERAAVVYARDLIAPLRAGLEALKAEPEKFKAFNPENGWGDYDGFVPWVERYLRACERYPDARVRASR